LAIHSGPGYKRGDNEENENPEVPANVDQAFKTDLTRVYADFEICPLEPERHGEMQVVCIAGEKHWTQRNGLKAQGVDGDGQKTW